MPSIGEYTAAPLWLAAHGHAAGGQPTPCTQLQLELVGGAVRGGGGHEGRGSRFSHPAKNGSQPECLQVTLYFHTVYEPHMCICKHECRLVHVHTHIHKHSHLHTHSDTCTSARAHPDSGRLQTHPLLDVSQNVFSQVPFLTNY